MTRKIPISFENAVRLTSEEWAKAFLTHNIDRAIWLPKNFVNWISEQGYHIEITGDEFEPAQMTDKIC